MTHKVLIIDAKSQFDKANGDGMHDELTDLFNRRYFQSRRCS